MSLSTIKTGLELYPLPHPKLSGDKWEEWLSLPATQNYLAYLQRRVYDISITDPTTDVDSDRAKMWFAAGIKEALRAVNAVQSDTAQTPEGEADNSEEEDNE